MIGEGASAEELWKMAKWGKFSASEIDVLTIPGKGDELFGQGGKTYIERIAREKYTTFNDDDNVETFAMRKGKMKEAEAFGRYIKIIGDIPGMEYYGGGSPYFEHYCPDSGSSPDLLVWKDKENKIVHWGGELKCPTAKTHWEYLRKIKNQFDLKEIDRTYYGQVQMNLLTFNAELWHWSTYNEYFPLKDQMHIIEVVPDKPYQDALKIRKKQAVKEVYKLLEEMKNR